MSYVPRTCSVAALLLIGVLLAGCSEGGQSSRCGNGEVEAGEACDGENLAQQTCGSLGYSGGTLSCAGNCRFDESGCIDSCGDGELDLGEEVCDGIDLGAASCQSEGFAGGTLACSEDCQGFVVSNCCDHGCPASGESECVADALRVCELGGTGCLGWTETDCSTTGEVCDDSGPTPVCTSPCSNACAEPDATYCVNATTLVTCADDGLGCLVWLESPCSDHCGGDPASCFVSGGGTTCDDIYNLDGRTFPHTVVGDFSGGVIPSPGSCQTGEHPLFLSYTLQSLLPGRLLLSATDHNGPPAWPQISAWSAQTAVEFCDPAQRVELGCVTSTAGTTEITLDTHARSQGDVLYFIISGDASPYPLHDPEIVVEEIDCASPAVVTMVRPTVTTDVDPRLDLVFEFVDPPVPTTGTVEIRENGWPVALFDLVASPSEISWSGVMMTIDPTAPLALGANVTVALDLTSSVCSNPITDTFTFTVASTLPPAGEDCADVIPANNHGVTAIGYYEANTLDILSSVLVDCRASYSGDTDSVWSFTLDASATAVEIAITKSTQNRLVAVLLDNCSSSTTSVACVTEWELPVFNLSATGLTPGSTYYLVVGNAYSAATYPDPGFTQFEITQLGQ